MSVWSGRFRSSLPPFTSQRFYRSVSQVQVAFTLCSSGYQKSCSAWSDVLWRYCWCLLFGLLTASAHPVPCSSGRSELADRGTYSLSSSFDQWLTTPKRIRVRYGPPRQTTELRPSAVFFARQDWMRCPSSGMFWKERWAWLGRGRNDPNSFHNWRRWFLSIARAMA